MLRHPLYIVLSLVIAVIMVGDFFFPYGLHHLPLPPQGQKVCLDVTVCSAPSMLKGAWTADVRLRDGGGKLRLVVPDSVRRAEVGDALTVEATCRRFGKLFQTFA